MIEPVAKCVARLIYVLIKNKEPYKDPYVDYEEIMVFCRSRNYSRKPANPRQMPSTL
jgi:hypothetical protein